MTPNAGAQLPDAVLAALDAARHTGPETPLQSATPATGDLTPNSPQPPSQELPALFEQPLPTSLNDVVHASRLYQQVGGAEMHIAMDTDLLGSIDLRAVIHQSTLTATIGVQRSDVQMLLTNDLPALQHSLSEQNLHVAQISILGNSIGSSTSQGDGRPQQQNQSVPIPGLPAGDSSGGNSSEDQLSASSEVQSVTSAGHLSVHV